MSNLKFRALVGLASALLIVWFLLPLVTAQPDIRSQALLGMSGYKAALPRALIAAVSWVSLTGQLCGLFGCLWFRRWARLLLLSAVVFAALSSPFVGFAVETSLGAFVGFMSTLLEGAVIAIAFTALDPKFS